MRHCRSRRSRSRRGAEHRQISWPARGNLCCVTVTTWQCHSRQRRRRLQGRQPLRGGNFVCGIFNLQFLSFRQLFGSQSFLGNSLPPIHPLTFLLIDVSLWLGLLTAPTGKPIPTTAHNTSSTSVYISWKPPSPDTILGEFLGYRITYRPRDRSPNDTKEIYIRDNTVEVSCLLSACYNNWISLPHCLWHSSTYWERQQAPQIVLAIDFH